MPDQVQGREHPLRGFIKNQAYLLWRNGKTTGIAYYFIIYSKILSGLVSWKKNNSGNDSSEYKGPMCNGQIEREGEERREGKVDKIGAEDAVVGPNGLS